jgi:proprotein convertase subtilisin/kexin type 5
LIGGSIAYLWNNTCYSTCPDGTYSTSTPNLCNSCDLKCIICSGSSTACSSCTLSGGNIAYLWNNTCITSCPDGTFYASSPNLCSTCDIKCILCSGSSTTCSSCTLNGSNMAYLWSNTCVTNCPNGTYLTANPNLCNACNTLCQLCDVSSTNCSLCSSTGYLLNLTCLAICPNPYYPDTNGGLGPNNCLQCSISCASCTNGVNSSCQSCNTGYMLSGSTCDTSCLAGYGPTLDPLVCVSCSASCKTCLNTAANCTDCFHSPTVYYLFKTGSSSTCVVSCPVSYFINATTYTCDTCPTGCYECTNNSYCYSCILTHAWVNNKCYNPCPTNYFKLNSTNCSQCSV